jgi:ElaB/YqjD/DUF883 family membrane-anchored ribosome-binding protein
VLLILMLVHLLQALTALPLWACDGIVGGLLAAGGIGLLVLGTQTLAQLPLVPQDTVDNDEGERPMAQRTGQAQQPNDERQAAVTENLGRVEERVQETVDGVTSTVERALEGFTQLQEPVEGAKAAVEEVLERVHVALKDTLDGVKTTVKRLDPAHLQQNPWTLMQTTAELIDPPHMNHNPWILIGSAIVMGYLLGTLELGSLGREHAASTSV